MTARNVAGEPNQTLGYDPQGRLISITESSQSVADFVYDADGVRVVRTVGDVTTYVINEQFEVEVDTSVSGLSLGEGLAPEAVEAAPTVEATEPITEDQPAPVAPADPQVAVPEPVTLPEPVDGASPPADAQEPAPETDATETAEETVSTLSPSASTEAAGSGLGGGLLGQVSILSTLNILLVSSQPGPHANDVAVKTRLEAAGHTVTTL